MSNLCTLCTVCTKLNSNKKIKPIIVGEPKVIYVMLHPEFEDDQGSRFCGEKGSFVRRVLNSAGVNDNYMMTYALKCFPALRVGYVPSKASREITQKEYKYCLPWLEEEILQYPNAKIQTFGKMAFTLLSGHETYMQKVGQQIEVEIQGHKRIVIPNYDPNYILKKGNLYNDMIRHARLPILDIKKPDFDRIVDVLPYDRAIEEVDRAIELYKNGTITHVYHDIENSISLLPWEGGEITVHAFCHDADIRAFSVPVCVNNEIVHDIGIEVKKFDHVVDEVKKEKIHAAFSRLLNTVPVVGHNYKYDSRWLIWKDIVDINKLRVHADTMIMGFMTVNNDVGHGLGLEDLSVRLLNADPWERVIKEYLGKYRLVKDRHYGNIPTGIICPYASRDVYWVRQLYHYFRKNMPDCSVAINDIVTGSIRSFLEPEIKGVKLDNDMYEFLKNNYSGIQKTIMEKIYELPKVQVMMAKYLSPLKEANKKKKNPLSKEEMYKKAFTLGSVPKMRETMYNYYNLNKSNKFVTKKGSAQVGKDVIDFYMEGDLKNPRTQLQEEAKEFLSNTKIWKRIDKLYSSYINAIPKYVTGDLYRPDYNLSSVTTGRLSSIFHSIPNRCDIKRLFTSRWRSDGGIILAGDYSQLELRVVSALSNESKFISAFKEGVDPHKSTAAIIYNKDVKSVTSTERQVGKTVNFAVLYLKIARTLAGDLNKTEEEAQSILNRFYSGANKLKEWQMRQIKFGLTNGYIETKFGRRIPIKSYLSTNRMERAEAERHSVNYPVQSTSSDIVLSSSLAVFNSKLTNSMRSVFCGCIHDSLEYDVYPGELIKVVNMMLDNAIKRPMSQYHWLTCPLEMSFEFGYSWGGALECEIEHVGKSDLVLKGSGLAKDCRMLEMLLRKVYNVKVDILDESELPIDHFPPDILFRDSIRQECMFSISSK